MTSQILPHKYDRIMQIMTRQIMSHKYHRIHYHINEHSYTFPFVPHVIICDGEQCHMHFLAH